MSARTRDLFAPLGPALLLGVAGSLACADEEAPAAPFEPTAESAPVETRPADFTGGAACVECHARETELWRGSHHDLAMQEATDATVLGDFDDARLAHFGVVSTFTRKDGAFVVRTDGPDGELADFEVRYTFGVDPLQQYLVEFPDGRLQALALAWDARPVTDGGQRWFHLYPREPIPSGDELHWTRRRQNWNFACAECHSTGLVKHYDEAADRYDTRWSEIDVSCEACHGPASRHVEWARAVEAGADPGADPTRGLTVRLKDRGGGAWVMNRETGIAERDAPRAPDTQMDTCGRCHSRRRALLEGYRPDEPLLDTHVPELLAERLYHPDGQILDEVYVWGSFVQSRMHHAGVRCSDCHDPHSGRVPTTDNGLCNVCHLPERFDTLEHTGHPGEGPGTRCVDCHMPETTYMVVDPRRDHGFRVPRPDLTDSLGVPNACNGCHADRDAAWAAQAVAEWHPDAAREEFASTLRIGRGGHPTEGLRLLARLAADGEAAAIVRATALDALGDFPDPQAFEVLASALDEEEDLLRLAGVRALAPFPPEARAVAAALLDDPRRAVRVEAARVLADAPPGSLPAERRDALDRALEELVASERFNADTPEAHLNLGVLHERAGRDDEAEAAYRHALRLDPLFAPASINLSDVLRRAERDAEGEQILRDALGRATLSPALHHALGLWLVRAGRTDEALESLRRAAELGPEDPRLGYVYGVALASGEDREAALAVYDAVLARHPYARDVHFARCTLLFELGRLREAREQGDFMATTWPRDPEVRQLQQQLGAAGR